MLLNSNHPGPNSSKKFNRLYNNWLAKETNSMYRFSTIFFFYNAYGITKEIWDLVDFS